MTMADVDRRLKRLEKTLRDLSRAMENYRTEKTVMPAGKSKKVEIKKTATSARCGGMRTLFRS